MGKREPRLDNAAIAELLVREAANAEGHRERAFRRAAHAAFLWPEEAADLIAAGRSVMELNGIGPSLAKRLEAWIASPPAGISPPPERSEFLTLAQARRILATDQSWAPRLQGDLQMHTQWSDGATTIAEMASAAAERGLRYIAITDHTKGLAIANGLDERRLAAQAKEIALVNQQLKANRVPLTVLQSAEVNLSPTGEGDMDSAALGKLDLVLGCFHSALRRTEHQTDRYIAGLRNPDIQILGHPQTRMWNRRLGLQCDWSRVFAEAARLDKAVEIDGDPARQDLRISLLKIAKREGCRISIGTDAHHPDELAYAELSLAAALLAKIPAERIVPFQPLKELKSWVASLRSS
jgi:histidinol phosphatase-like PHP family hydrolase